MAVTFLSEIRPDLRRKPALLRRFAVLAVADLCLLVLVVAAVRPGGGAAGLALALVLYLAGNLWLFAGLIRAYPHRRLGLCNGVTHARFALICAMGAALPAAYHGVLAPGALWAIVALAVVALVCDGVDGWAARRSGLASAVGARFDMEVDSIFALILALLVWQTQKVGDWVLLLGLMRYLFVAAGWCLDWINKPTPPRFSSKLICVTQIAVLIALVAPMTGPDLAPVLAALTLAAVVWSFGVDLRYLWQGRSA